MSPVVRRERSPPGESFYLSGMLGPIYPGCIHVTCSDNLNPYKSSFSKPMKRAPKDPEHEAVGISQKQEALHKKQWWLANLAKEYENLEGDR